MINILIMPNWKIIDLIKRYDINYTYLSGNTHPEAIKILTKNKDKICWKYLSQNPSAIELLKKNKDKIIYRYLERNPNPEAFKILKEKIRIDEEIAKEKWKNRGNSWFMKKINIDINNQIEWFGIWSNPNSIEFIENNLYLDKINWFSLSSNTNPDVIKYLQKNPDKIVWSQLRGNPSAIDLLVNNPDKIDWFNLSYNPSAIDLLSKNPDKIDKRMLYSNSNNDAYKLIKTIFTDIYDFEKLYLISRNEGEWILDYINENINEFNDNDNDNDIRFMFVNPLIFTYDYEMMKKNNEEFEEELIKEVMKPSRIFKMIEKYGDDYLEILYE